MIDNVNYIFVCPAYRLDYDMAKVKKAIIPNRLELTPGQITVGLPETKSELNYLNSYYDPKLKKRVPKQQEIVIIDTSEGKPKKEKPLTSPTQKKTVEDLMINNTDVRVENYFHSSDFLPPDICTRLWTLSRGSETGWAWYMKEVDGYKTKFEFYCRPHELLDSLKQYNRGGSFITHAYLRSDFPSLDIIELSHDKLRSLKLELIKEKPVESVQLIIDIILSKYKADEYFVK